MQLCLRKACLDKNYSKRKKFGVFLMMKGGCKLHLTVYEISVCINGKHKGRKGLNTLVVQPDYLIFGNI